VTGVTVGEFAFLALGLVLGLATGAALVEVLRSRPPAPRQIRVTVAPGSVPIRSSTLAMDPFEPNPTGPAPFGPADRRLVDRSTDGPGPGILPDARDAPTNDLPVPSFAWSAGPTGAPVWPSDAAPTRTLVPDLTDSRPPLAPGGGFSAAPLATAPPELVGLPIEPASNGLFEALLAADARATLVLGATTTARDRSSTATTTAPGDRVATLTAIADPAADGRPLRHPAAMVDSGTMQDRVMATTGPADAASGAAADRPAAGDPCGELRSVADDRCAVATRARQGATTARDALRDAQLQYDAHISRAEAAESLADPRAIRAAKEEAQAAFRRARYVARGRDSLDAAATTWLGVINRINSEARDGAARASREHSAAQALVTVIERLEVEADAARIGAEAAEEACVAARQAVADCQETAARTPVPPVLVAAVERYPVDEPELLAEAPGDREARILRLLRGDRDALLRTVAELAGDDPDAQRRWQLAITGLVEAITAQAIEASAIDLPEDHPFWSPFTRTQRRDIVAALASLGYRLDGLGGFADGRVPSQRDLSLAVGYAGLDPMRIRRWPSEAEMPGLVHEATVAADEYLAEAAGGLSLGELVALLGRRADGLTDLWNEWGRVRPRLLATD
jgi:hypothetical protein